jgi:hypothetical protein
VHVVTLLEDMPVQETIDAVAELRALKLPVGAIVVNQVRGDLLEDSELAATVDPAQLVSDCAAAGLDISPAIADGLVAQVMAHTERLAMEADHLATLTAAGLPVVTVPALLDGIDPDALRQIADLLTEHGMVP